MKFKEVFFTFVVLYLSFQFSLGQDKFSPKVLSSIYPSNCEYVLQHVYLLVKELEKNPNSIGYIVIKRQRQQSQKLNLDGFYYEDLISLELRFRHPSFDKNRLRIIRGESDKYQIDFMIVSDESNKPNFTEVKWDFNIPSKLVLFDEGYGGQLCAETPYNLSTFSQILAAYPKAYGKFVIYADTIKDFPKQKEVIVEEINKVGIPLNRFRFYFKKDKSTLNPYAKLWLIP